jgi:hypothetical protein
VERSRSPTTILAQQAHVFPPGTVGGEWPDKIALLAADNRGHAFELLVDTASRLTLHIRPTTINSRPFRPHCRPAAEVLGCRRSHRSC